MKRFAMLLAAVVAVFPVLTSVSAYELTPDQESLKVDGRWYLVVTLGNQLLGTACAEYIKDGYYPTGGTVADCVGQTLLRSTQKQADPRRIGAKTQLLIPYKEELRDTSGEETTTTKASVSQKNTTGQPQDVLPKQLQHAVVDISRLRGDIINLKREKQVLEDWVTVLLIQKARLEADEPLTRIFRSVYGLTTAIVVLLLCACFLIWCAHQLLMRVLYALEQHRLAEHVGEAPYMVGRVYSKKLSEHETSFGAGGAEFRLIGIREDPSDGLLRTWHCLATGREFEFLVEKEQSLLAPYIRAALVANSRARDEDQETNIVPLKARHKASAGD